MQIHALLTDAYGGSGGIAVFNRDLLQAFCSHPRVDRVIALPRVISRPLEALPDKLDYKRAAAGGKVAFAAALAAELPAIAKSDLIYCAHLNLAPIAWALGRLFGIPVLGALYGIEAWAPRGRMLANQAAARLDGYFAISDFTRQRFLRWAGGAQGRISLLPNAIHAERFGLGDRSDVLAERLGVKDRTVLLTLGRIVSRERAKGFDEVIDILPELARETPDVIYLIAGDGEYRMDLERKVAHRGLQDRVVFTGFVSESEKADLYRLADAYVMPSRGEGFGFVFLEAMACGVPVVASSVDGSRDAVRDGQLGRMVDPERPADLKRAILDALKDAREVPQGLSYFSFENFAGRVHALIEDLVDADRRETSPQYRHA